MDINKIIFVLLIIFLASNYSCQTKKITSTNNSVVSSIPVDESKTLFRIALGSCNRSDFKQPLWRPILKKKPDLWGVWDDHDYGVNDGGKEYPKRSESRDILLDFLDVPKSNPVWKREGAYQSYTFGESGKKVKIILLDARYFRDRVERRRKENPQYIPNLEGTILGEDQWNWLEKELKNSNAQIHIIGSGIQILPIQHNFEKWNTFPHERDRLFNLLVKHQVPGAIFISGDRHIGEISKKEIEGLDYPLVELTTSGLTHTYENASEENNFRIGQLTDQLNFGFIEIDWTRNNPIVDVEIRGIEGKLFQTYNINYNF